MMARRLIMRSKPDPISWTGQIDYVEDADLLTLYESPEWNLPAAIPLNTPLVLLGGEVRYQPPGSSSWTQWVSSGLIVTGGGKIQLRQLSSDERLAQTQGQIKIAGVPWKLVITTKVAAECGEFSEFSLLHAFSYAPANGSDPYGDLTLVGDTLYGMTPSGGANGTGTIFSVRVDGSDFTLLHSFGSNGSPFGSLTLVGSLLYGMTFGDWANEKGVIFSIALDGSSFTVVHEFKGNNPANGSTPHGNNLIAADDKLFGMTQYGGANNAGTIFSIGQDGTNFTVIHSFQSFSTSNGAFPRGSLTIVGTKLFGMTIAGGEGYEGVVFSIGKDGSGFTIHHSFIENRGAPWGSLILVEDTLYGMTHGAGAEEEGTIFSIGADGNNYSLLYLFGELSNGSDVEIYGDLTLVNGTLYGMTYGGGDNNAGVIFSIIPDGSEFTVVHSFSEEAAGYPRGSLIYSDCALYGMVEYGGANNWAGAVFSLSAPSP